MKTAYYFYRSFQWFAVYRVNQYLSPLPIYALSTHHINLSMIVMLTY